MTRAGSRSTPALVVVALALLPTAMSFIGGRIERRANAAQATSARSNASEADQRGQITTERSAHGVYIRYVPKQRPQRILLLIHGTVAEKGGDGRAEADAYVHMFQVEADQRRLLLIAPAFDDENYGSFAGPGGGYRGLFGREVRADEFVNEILDATRTAYPKLEPRIELVGHSAGGQFVSRYLVMHPQRVRVAVISSAGTFAFPDPGFPWADGMKPLKRTWTWGPGPEKKIEITPDPQGWLAAAQLPITVLVAEKDEVGVPTVAGQRGADVPERSRLWVEAMNEYAKANGQHGRVRYQLVPKARHSMAELFPACRRALRER